MQITAPVRVILASPVKAYATASWYADWLGSPDFSTVLKDGSFYLEFSNEREPVTLFCAKSGTHWVFGAEHGNATLPEDLETALGLLTAPLSDDTEDSTEA